MSNDLTVPIDWPIVKPGESLYTGNDWGTIPSDLIDSIEPPTPYRFSKRKFHRLVSQLAETLQFGNLSIYRLDLLLAEKYHDLDYSVFMDCVKRFTERVKTKHEYADGLAMIQRVVEYGESRGYHLHMLVCYRWRACKNPHVRVNALINEWKRCCEHLEVMGAPVGQGFAKAFRSGYGNYGTIGPKFFFLPREIVRQARWKDGDWQNVCRALRYFSKEDEHFETMGIEARRTQTYLGPYYWVDYTEPTQLNQNVILSLKNKREYETTKAEQLALDFRYVLSKQPLIYPEGFWYTLDHGSDYHWYDSGEGSRPHPLLYAVFWLKSRLEALSTQHVKLKLYTAKVPGSLHLSTDEDWDVFTERLKTASTYDGFIAKYHFVERD